MPLDGCLEAVIRTPKIENLLPPLLFTIMFGALLMDIVTVL